jgi:hypothetical protein
MRLSPLYSAVPDARQHERRTVLTGKLVGLFAAFIAPLVETLRRDYASSSFQMRVELAAFQSISADVEQRWSRLAVPCQSD